MPPPRLSISAGRIESVAHHAATQYRDRSDVFVDEMSRRPATAPLENHVDYIGQAIPPRRELPFKSSSSRLSVSSSGKDQGARSSSAAVDLPPLPVPKVVSGGGHTPSVLISHSSKGSRAVFAELGQQTSTSSVVGRSSSPPLPVTSPVRQGDRTFDLAAGDCEAPNGRSEGVKNNDSVPCNKAPLRDSARYELRSNAANRSGDGSATNQAPGQSIASSIQDENTLAGYAARSEEDRMDALESTICGLIYDEDFLRLSEDVECCWRRIGLSR